MNNVVALKLHPGAANGRLPANYEQAKEALAHCERIDECQDWADRAEALSSYARQINDDSLRTLADRIQARAVRKAGILLKQIPPAHGANQNISDGGATNVTRKSVATKAGLSERQRNTAIRVANVPTKEFEEAVEGYKPPTISQLALLGRKHRERGRPSEKKTAVNQDFLKPADADRGLVLLAERLDTGLFLPTPGQLACLKEAMTRATAKHRKIIEEAAFTLSELVR